MLTLKTTLMTFPHQNLPRLFMTRLLILLCLALLPTLAFTPQPVLAQAATLKQSVGDAADNAETVTHKLAVGLADAQPESGRFVACERPKATFMVPYTATIPGTDVTYEMVPIPGGTFYLGSPEDQSERGSDEGPVVSVQVQPFWMGKFEITWAEYRQYMQLDEQFKQLQQAGLRKVTTENEIDAITAPSVLYDPDFTYDAGEGDRQPAATMTQYAAKQYTKWLSLISGRFYRLPTEAEWEYACRAGTQTAFSFGDDPDDLAAHGWYADNSDDERHEVGQLPANAWGLHDMHGNVAEWVLDAHSTNGYQRLADLKLSAVPAADAWLRPTKLFPRVLRGGSWELDASDCRSAARLASHDKDWSLEDPNFPKSPWWFTDSPGLGVGFRIIRPLDAPATRQDQESFWKADIRKITRDTKDRIDSNGRGAWGIVDRNLPRDIATLDE